MRLGLVLLLLFKCDLSYAGRLTVEKAEAFFKKEKPCTLAIAPIYPEKKFQDRATDVGQRLAQANDGEIMIQMGNDDSDVQILCVFEGTKYAGTINEIKGCTAGFFNPSSGEWTGILNEKARKYIGIGGKSCSKEVVKELLTSIKISNVLKNDFVGTSLKNQLGNYNTIFELYLRMLDRILHPDLRVLYDEHNLTGSLCPKSPCGPIIRLQEQLAAIKPDDEDVRRKRAWEFVKSFESVPTAAEVEIAVPSSVLKYYIENEASGNTPELKGIRKTFLEDLSDLLALEFFYDNFCKNSLKFQVCQSVPPWYKPLSENLINEYKGYFLSEVKGRHIRNYKARNMNRGAFELANGILESDHSINIEQIFQKNISMINSRKLQILGQLANGKKAIASVKALKNVKKADLFREKNKMTKSIDSNDFPNVKACYRFCDTQFAKSSDIAWSCVETCKKKFD